jgi:hypothetical protein
MVGPRDGDGGCWRSLVSRRLLDPVAQPAWCVAAGWDGEIGPWSGVVGGIMAPSRSMADSRSCTAKPSH